MLPVLGGDAVEAPREYFEMFGDRALYRDGWIASTRRCGRHG
jgi:hypothetical protein